MKIQYDAHVRQVLKDKNILAYILVYCVEEFKDYTIEEAKECIDGEPEVACREVRASAARTLENESKIPGEGKMYFDIVFFVITKGLERQKIYVNIEAQKSFYPGYDLVTRGIIYPARLISQQMDVEYTAENYNGVKKTYSIWLCLNAPSKNEADQQVADSIVKYSLKPDVLYPVGKSVGEVATGRYDILSSVFINLSAKTLKSGNKLIAMLSTLLSDTLEIKEKKKRLEEEYNIPMTEELEKGAAAMCNLSEAIEERGIKKGIEQGIEKGIEQGIEKGIEQGIEKGIEKGIRGLVDTLKELGIPKEVVVQKIMEKFSLTEEKAREFVDD